MIGMIHFQISVILKLILHIVCPSEPEHKMCRGFWRDVGAVEDGNSGAGPLFTVRGLGMPWAMGADGAL